MKADPVAGNLTLCLSKKTDRDLRAMQQEAISATLPAEVLIVGYRVARVYASDFGREAIFNWNRLSLTITGPTMSQEFMYEEEKNCFVGRELDNEQFIIAVNFFCWLTSEVAVYNETNPGLLLDPRIGSERSFRWDTTDKEFRPLEREEQKILDQLLQMLSDKVGGELRFRENELFMGEKRVVRFDKKSSCLIAEGLPRTLASASITFYCLYLNILET